MQTIDKKLKELYEQGFNDELSSKKPIDWFKSEIEKKAYFAGRANAIFNEGKSWEEILKDIKSL